MNIKENDIAEIKTALDAIDFALEEIRGAQKNIQENRMLIHQILNGENVDDYFQQDLTEPL